MSNPNPTGSTNPNSPLTSQHLAAINNAMDVIRIAEDQIAQALRAGIDVSEQQTNLQAAKKQLGQIKQVYFPGQ